MFDSTVLSVMIHYCNDTVRLRTTVQYSIDGSVNGSDRLSKTLILNVPNFCKLYPRNPRRFGCAAVIPQMDIIRAGRKR